MNCKKTFKINACRHAELKSPNVMNAAMTESKPMLPTLFQIAANWDNYAPASTLKNSPVLGQIPFADLMLNPQKLVIALKAAKAEKTRSPQPY